MHRAALALLVCLPACGGAPPPVAHSEPPPEEPVLALPNAGVIVRSELESVLDQGPGVFLSRLEIAPVMEGDAFVAFQVVALRDEALFAGVDLLPGDRLVSINGQTIERPEHAMSVWSSLRVASELTVVVLRGGQPRELRFAIVD